MCYCPPVYLNSPFVICANRDLTALPTFDAIEDPFYSPFGSYDEENIYLSTNMITEIPERAFVRLGKLYRGDMLNIDLSFNRISRIDLNALEGLENNTVGLKLRSNLLTFFPEDLVNNQNILSLDLTLNPIKTLSTEFILALAPTLKEFYLTVNDFPEVPKALGFLQADAIGIDGLQETELKATIQDNDYTIELKEFTISNSTLEDASNIPCRFPNLKALYLEDDLSLNTILFDNCNVNVNLPLRILKIENCNMVMVNFSIFQNIVLLSLRQNSLESVPGSIARLARVETIDLSNNLISEITDDDFEGLSVLNKLYLHDNPLKHISDSAFVTNNVQYLSLRNTLLTTVPLALVKNHPNSFLKLPLNSIECTCSSFAPLKGFNISASIAGDANCKNHPEKQIYAFIRDEFPLCLNEN